jgi:endonuclease/exonuclease/phosphatase family metal-dependent hydrolase
VVFSIVSHKRLSTMTFQPFIVWPVARRVLSAAALAILIAGCAPIQKVVRRDVAQLNLAPDARVAWFAPASTDDEAALIRWRSAVGRAVLPSPSYANVFPSDTLTVVSWNIANGQGDVIELARTLPAGVPIVMLLQEAYRGGPEVPSKLEPRASYAGRLGGAQASPDALEVEAIADALDLNIYYVPSMRNGGESSDEDRGNAILSNLPLTDLMAVELPFERQRRVAVAAMVHGASSDGTPWRLRVASAHLDNFAGARHGWLGGEYARTRQARALRDVLADGLPTILGADLNTWFGFAEPAYVETARAFPQTHVTDGRPTFRGLLRLDHLFYQLAPRWQATFRRADQRFGSDHYPLIGTVRIPSGMARGPSSDAGRGF